LQALWPSRQQAKQDSIVENAFAAFIERCNLALDTPDPQASVEAVLLDATRHPDIVDAVAERTKFASLSDLAIHRSERLTLLAGTLPPGFVATPHNHNLWSVVGVCAGQEDNQFFERDGDGLRQVGQASVVGPGVLPNGPDVIHAICNPLDVPLLVLHAYGGDLFATPRSNWDPETHEEIPFDWEKVRSKADA
jgi:predicted metal-dependent enzyme (double-stranded beta helix superfamily)